nr:zinc finger, CCHC-type [Tanacetum cinerariifolium]
GEKGTGQAPISINCDSAATLATAYSQMYNGKSKHLGFRHSMIRELIMNGVRAEAHVLQIIPRMCLEPASKEDGVANFSMVNFFKKVLSKSMNKEEPPMTMDTIIEQQVAMDEALVPSAQRCPFFKAFLVTADVAEIYMQEFWATANVHHHSIRFKMDNKKHIVNLESFREMLHISPRIPELTNEEIRNSKAYKEYYAIATGEAAPKHKVSAKRTRSGSDTSITPPTAAATPRPTVVATPRLTAAKGKQTAKASKAKSLSALSEVAKTEAQQLKLATRRSMQQTHISQPSGSGADEGTGSKSGVPDVPTDESEEELSWNSTDDEGADDEGKVGDDDEEDERDDDDDEGEEDDDDEDKDGGSDEDDDDKETKDEESFDPIPRTPESSKDEGNGEEDQGLNIGEKERLNEEEEADELYRDVDINQGRGMESIFETASTSMVPLPVTAPTMTPSTITTTSQAPILPTIILSEIFNTYQMNETVRFAVQIQSDRLQDGAQKENDEFLRSVDENMKKIIKKQVKEQVKVQVSKILPRIEQAVNEQLEAEVLTRSSHSSRTSYAVAADLSEMELKKILIKKMEGNKSIQRSDEQRNLYEALVEAYEADKIILDTYRETVTLKRRRDDDVDKDEGPSTGPDRGSKRRREGKEPESASAPSKPATKSAGRSTIGSKSRQASASESAFAEEPVQTTSQIEEPSHPEFETGAEDQPIVQSSQHLECELAKQADTRFSFNELLDTSLDFSNFIMNRLRVDTLTPELLVGPTYDLMKGSCKSLIELEYHLEEVYKATADQLDWVNPEDYRHIKWIEDLVPRNMWIQEPIDYDKHALWGVSHWGRKCKLTNLTVEERFAFNGSLRMFTRSIVIQRHVEDLQLSVESYQKKLNLTKPDRYRSDLKHNEAYTAYSNPWGFIYQNKDKKNRLMRIDELHKFSDGMLIDVRTALDDRLKGIQMQYLPQTIWRRSDKDRAAIMIQAIDKRLKTRRVMRSLEMFVGGRLYEGDFMMLQRTI